MRSPGRVVKIGVTAAAMLLLLTWFPQALRPLQVPWGVTECWGEEPGQATQTLGLITSGNISVTQFLLMNQGDTGGSYSSELSLFRGVGISSVQQGAGFNNNQCSVVAVNLGASDPSLNYSGDIQGDPNNLTLNNSSKYNVAITGGAFANGRGLACVSQVSGNWNNQFTSIRFCLGRCSSPSSSSPTTIGITSGSGTTVSLSNAQLSVIASRENTVPISQTDPDRYKASLAPGAFQNFTGISNVSQVSGNLSTVFSNVNVTLKPY